MTGQNKVLGLPTAALINVWDSLKWFLGNESGPYRDTPTMDDWAEMVNGELDRRGGYSYLVANLKKGR